MSRKSFCRLGLQRLFSTGGEKWWPEMHLLFTGYRAWDLKEEGDSIFIFLGCMFKFYTHRGGTCYVALIPPPPLSLIKRPSVYKNNGEDKCSTAMKVNCALTKCNGSNTKTFGENSFISQHFFLGGEGGWGSTILIECQYLTLTFTTSSPGHPQSQGKAPWGRGCDFH